MTECYYHPDRAAVSACSRCGQPICQECSYIGGIQPICRNCWNKQHSTPEIEKVVLPYKSERGEVAKCCNHPETDSIALCTECQKPICNQCAIWDGKYFCESCAKKLNKPIWKKQFLIVFFVCFVLGLITIGRDIISSGFISLGHIVEFAGIFILGFIIWGIVHLISAGKRKTKSDKK